MSETYEEHDLPTADGPRVHYRTYEPKGAAVGAPVLCLHGRLRATSGISRIWRR